MPSCTSWSNSWKLPGKCFYWTILLFTLTSYNLHLCPTLGPWWTAVWCDELDFICWSQSQTTATLEFLHLMTVFSRCDLVQFQHHFSRSNGSPWIPKYIPIPGKHFGNLKYVIYYPLSVLENWKRGLCCWSRTAAKPNKCSRAIKVPCAILAAKWEGGLNRNHLWYIKPLLETCGSESH